MDNTPDFDNMSPEEIMRWMETLAARQGATEGLTTSHDMNIAEIDPTTVVIDEPGYVPYGQEGKQPPKPEPAKAAPPKPEPVKVAAPPPEPVKAAAPPPRIIEKRAPVPEPQRPAARQTPPPPPPAPEPARAEQSGLAWLESLAGGQDDNSLFNLDLSSLPTSAEEPMLASSPMSEQASSLSWLEDLARTQDEPAVEAVSARPSEPFGGSDSVEWLESLARRQGADTEELITPAQLDIPLPDEAEIEEPGYVAFSFDSPPVTNRAPAPTLSDPSDFLSSLSEEVPDQPDEEMSIDSIQRAIASGTVTREQMQVFLEHQTDALVNEPEAEFPILEDDEELAPADLPDWLLEQVGAPPAEPQSFPAPTASFESLFPTASASENMPDWLKEDVEADEAQMDFGSLFSQEPEVEIVAQVTPAASTEMDPNDTWAEAFDLEHEGGIIDVDAVPDWYERNVKDPARIAAVEQLERRDEDLLDEPLPGDDLPVGEAQDIPDWLDALPQVEEEEEVQPAEPAFADWLADLQNPEAVEVPGWLTDPTPEETPIEIFEPVIEPEPPVRMVQPPPPPTPQPAPPRAAPQPSPVGGSAALERARDREQNGDLEGSLSEYEGLIRANIDLDTAVADLTQLVKSYRTVPSVYRVLGDGLMRQGKLQAALNTYREALNQL